MHGKPRGEWDFSRWYTGGWSGDISTRFSNISTWAARSDNNAPRASRIRNLHGESRLTRGSASCCMKSSTIIAQYSRRMVSDGSGRDTEVSWSPAKVSTAAAVWSTSCRISFCGSIVDLSAFTAFSMHWLTRSQIWLLLSRFTDEVLRISRLESIIVICGLNVEPEARNRMPLTCRLSKKSLAVRCK